jgi:uncharacterized protein YdhG (YjbR/CyaY superfamily)
MNKVDEYIEKFPPEIQVKLENIRKLIFEVAPNVKESISYAMPAYSLKECPLVYFAAYEKHIGFYPTANGIKVFEKDLQNYKHAKGSIQFPHNKQLPLDLIEKIVSFRAQNMELNKQ